MYESLRYGDEGALSHFTAALQAIISVAEGSGADKDKLHSVSAGAHHRMVFLTRGPVYLVALAATGKARCLAVCAPCTRTHSPHHPPPPPHLPLLYPTPKALYLIVCS
jgi:hypothetical protein